MKCTEQERGEWGPRQPVDCKTAIDVYTEIAMQQTRTTSRHRRKWPVRYTGQKPSLTSYGHI